MEVKPYPQPLSLQTERLVIGLQGGHRLETALPLLHLIPLRVLEPNAAVRATWLEFDRLFQPSRAMAQAFHWLTRDPNHALEVLPKIQAQTLVLTGRFDRNGGAQLNREVADLLPNSSFAIFERSAHFPDIEEKNLYCKTVSDF